MPALSLWSLVAWGTGLRSLWSDGDGVGLGWHIEAEAELLGGPTLDIERFLTFLAHAALILMALWVMRSALRLWRDGASNPLTSVSGAATVLAFASVAGSLALAYQLVRGDGWSGPQVLLPLVSAGLGLIVLLERFGESSPGRGLPKIDFTADRESPRVR